MVGGAALNPEQMRAATHLGSPLVVFAGAGSGKTRVITHRIAYLVGESGVQPWRIMAVTFTNKAAAEMRERLYGLLGRGTDGLVVGTFHATCARFLRQYAEQLGVDPNFTIYDDSDQQALVKRILRDEGIDEKRHPVKQVAGRINRCKQELVSPDSMQTPDGWSEIAQRVYRIYEKRLEQSRAIDFGGLISTFTVGLERDGEFRQHLASRFEHLLVDEFQDTNHAQFRLVKALGSVHRNVCVVGDDDQSIYRWRGADRRNILDFRSSFPNAELIKLEQNYRSTKRILRVAHAVISKNTDREPKELWTDNDNGQKIVITKTMNERDEARVIVGAVQESLLEGRAPSDLAIFYRIHAQSRVLEEAFSSANIAYRIVGGVRFYDRAEVKDVLAYLRVLENPADDVSLLRIINKPARGIGKTSIGRLMDAAMMKGCSVWDALTDEMVRAQFGAAAQKKLGAFASLILSLRKQLDEGSSAVDVANEVLKQTGYLDVLRADDSVEADARIQNVAELAQSIEEFEREHDGATLSDYLQNVTLQTAADQAQEGPAVTMMTVHAAKGLEFPVVIVSGMEEQLFPFKGVDPWEDPEELEEERRLAYVAFTRAQERLMLTHTSIRRVFGQERVAMASRFLQELPEDDVVWLGRARPAFSSSAAPSTSSSPDGSYLDFSESDLELDGLLKRGMRVSHPKFGIGEVKEIIEGSPPRARVRFDGWGERRIIMSYLSPA